MEKILMQTYHVYHHCAQRNEAVFVFRKYTNQRKQRIAVYFRNSSGITRCPSV